MKSFYCFLALALLCLGFTQTYKTHFSHSSLAGGGLAIQIIDATPNFLKFYDTASLKKLDPESRWQLWQKTYGFAAVPPGPDGQKMARTLLDSAWSKYPGVMERIRQGVSVLKPSPQSILERVAKLLNLDTSRDSVKIKLIVFVGGLENNAFAFTDHGVPTVAIPIEADDKYLELTMIHEFTHAVHTKIAGLSGAYVTSIAQLVMSEGLAMRVTEQLSPGQTAEIYTNAHSDSWLKVANGRRTAILKGVQQHLADSSSAAMTQFTFGSGTTGLGREGYYAGWIIVGELEKQGITLASLAQMPPARIKEVLNKTINEMLKG